MLLSCFSAPLKKRQLSDLVKRSPVAEQQIQHKYALASTWRTIYGFGFVFSFSYRNDTLWWWWGGRKRKYLKLSTVNTKVLVIHFGRHTRLAVPTLTRSVAYCDAVSRHNNGWRSRRSSGKTLIQVNNTKGCRNFSRLSPSLCLLTEHAFNAEENRPYNTVMVRCSPETNTWQ